MLTAMVLFYVSIPLMVLGVAIAWVPLVWSMHSEHRLHTHTRR
jgi:hypothetical protein